MMTTIFTGLLIGSVYALIAIGYNITIATANVLNFAFANVMVLGGFVAYAGLQAGLPVIAAVALSVVVCAVTNILVERLALRWIPQGAHAELVTTVGAATVLTGLTALIWGADPIRFSLLPGGMVTLLGSRTSWTNILIVLGVIAVAIALHLVAHGTKVGLASRSYAQDSEAAMLRGVNIRWLAIGAFGLAGVIAGLLGPLVVASVSASPFLALTLAVKGFIAMTLGGVGSQIGGLIGGLSIGLLEATSGYWLGVVWSDVSVFIAFIAVLLLRPRGLFGRTSLRFV